MKKHGVVLIVGAFAISFFATAVIRKASHAENVAGTASTERTRTARIREREESLSRDLEDLRREEMRLRDLIARKTQPGSPARSAVVGLPGGTTEASAATLLAGLEFKAMVRRKLRAAREELGLNQSQLETYEALMQREEHNPSLKMFERGIDRFDHATLLPILDNDQLARYRAREARLADEQFKIHIQNEMRNYDIDTETAGKVLQVWKDEGLYDPNAALRKAYENPNQKDAVIEDLEKAVIRSLARLRPLLPPASYLKAERSVSDYLKSVRTKLEDLEPD